MADIPPMEWLTPERRSPLSSETSTKVWSSPEVPNSKDESDDIIHQSEATTRDKRLQIRTAIQFAIPTKRIIEVLHVTKTQIKYAKRHRLTPQVHHGRNPFIKTPNRNYLAQWIEASPSHRRIAYTKIPHHTGLPFGTKAIHTAFDLIGYTRKKSHKKGFSDDPAVARKQLAFAEQGLTWSFKRVMNQIFSDEVWAMGGAHTEQYVSVKSNGIVLHIPCFVYANKP
jgi:hypothetical protein